MLVRKNNLKLYELLFLIAFYMYSITFILFGASNIGQLFDTSKLTLVSNVIIISLLVFSFFLKRHKISSWFISGILILLGVVVYIYTKESPFLFLVLFFVTAIDKLKESKILKIDFFIKIFFVLFILILGMLNVIPSISSARSALLGSGTRLSFGFTHPNVLGAVFLSLVAEWAYIRKEKVSYIEIILMLFLTVLLNKFVNPRSAVDVSIILIFLLFIMKMPTKKMLSSVLHSRAIIFSYIIGFFLSLYSSINYVGGSNTVWSRLNTLFSGRLDIANFYFTFMNKSWLPQNLPMYEMSGVSVLDNTYIYILLHLGILVVIAFLIITLVVGEDLTKYSDDYGIIIFICFSIFGLMESTAFYPAINIVLIFGISKKVLKSEGKNGFKI